MSLAMRYGWGQKRRLHLGGILGWVSGSIVARLGGPRARRALSCQERKMSKIGTESHHRDDWRKLRAHRSTGRRHSTGSPWQDCGRKRCCGCAATYKRVTRSEAN